MKDGWELKSLNEIGVCQTGTTPKTNRKEYYGRFIPFVKPADIDIYNDGAIRYDNEGLSVEGLQVARKIPAGSLLMVCIGASIGKVGFIDRDVACNQQINTLSVKKVFFSRFFYYALCSFEFQNQVRKKSSQATLPIINKGKWECLKVFFPSSMTEQKNIVAILDKAFEAIDKAKANAEQNLKNAKELFESYLQSVFETKGEGWDEKTLGEVCLIKPPKNEVRSLLSDDDLVSFVPMENLKILVKDLELKQEKKVKDVIKGYTYFSDEDVLLAKITPCFENGKLGIARNLKNGIGFGSSEYIVFRLSNSLIADYLFYFLSRQQFRDEGKQVMTGAVGHKRVPKEFVENYLVPLAPLPEQKEIVEKLDALSVKTKKLEAIYQQKLSDLEELKKSILQKAFSGELKTAEVAVA